MKKPILALFVALGFSLNAYAEKNEYLASRIGIMSTDHQRTLVSPGLYYGQSITANHAVEGEFNLGFQARNKQQLIVKNIAAFGVYRYPIAPFSYFKGKLGLALTEQQLGTDISHNASIAGGIGAGLRLQKKLTLEGEYTLLTSRFSFASLGIHYMF